MKNKKTIGILTMAGLCAVIPMTVGARTWGSEKADGTVTYYQEKPEKKIITSKEQERYEKYAREKNKEDLAYLKEYDVTYDTETGTAYYKGEKIRWLIDDDSFGGCYSTYFTTDGTADVYTIRNEDGVLTGVRKATQKEFDDQKEPETGWVNGSCEAVEEAWIYSYQEKDAIMEENMWENDRQEQTFSEEIQVEQAFAVNADQEWEDDWEDSRRREYEGLGLVPNDNQGGYTWNGKQVFLIVDDNGSLSSYGFSNNKKERIYVHIVRDDSGKAVEAEVVSAKELLKELALQDIKE